MSLCSLSLVCLGQAACPWCVLRSAQEPLHALASQLLAILCLVAAVHANHFQYTSSQSVVQALSSECQVGL